MTIDIKRDVPLAQYTTMRIGGPASFFVIVKSIDELKEAVNFAKKEGIKFFVLGGGSNILIQDEGFDGLVIKNEIGGMDFKEDGNTVYAKVGAGIWWDDFVKESVYRNYFGLENLSFIPGVVGASPVQNIGAYGVEVKDCISKVSVFDTLSGDVLHLSKDQCGFGYRTSIFKKTEFKNYIIVEVEFVLSKEGTVSISYKDFANYFKSQDNPSLSEVRNTVIDIRSKKLPDWREVGTAGSFFKNPILPKNKVEDLIKKYKDLPVFVVDEECSKIPAGWLIEHVGMFKGEREGDVGSWKNQSLVIVNFGKATFHDVDLFAKKIEEKISKETGIKLEREVETI